MTLLSEDEDLYGRAKYLYAGDNGEGDEGEGCVDEELPSRQRYDELNMVLERESSMAGRADAFDINGSFWTFCIEKRQLIDGTIKDAQSALFHCREGTKCLGG